MSSDSNLSITQFSKRKKPLFLLSYLLMVLAVLAVAVIKHQPQTTSIFASMPKTPLTYTTLSPSPDIPIDLFTYPAPQITAQSAIVIDYDSNTILFQKNPHTQHMPASTTKIMTALVALDTYDLNHVITITKEEDTKGHTLNLVRGEQITVQNLLSGMLVGSGNDAALALALDYPHGGYSGFVSAMNQKAQELGLTNTSFKNVSGVESPGHLTTASDLAKLTHYALNNPTFRSMVATKQTTVSSIDNQYQHVLANTNELLGNLPGVIGVKTGWTENAGECLVTSVVRNDHQIITVVLKSQDRFGDSTRLIDWIYSTYDWIKATEKIDQLPVK